MRFEVEITISKTVTVDAANRSEAGKAAAAAHRAVLGCDCKAISVDDEEIIGCCEGCGVLLFDGEKSHTDPEGVTLCEDCYLEMVKSEDTTAQ